MVEAFKPNFLFVVFSPLFVIKKKIIKNIYFLFEYPNLIQNIFVLSRIGNKIVFNFNFFFKKLVAL